MTTRFLRRHSLLLASCAAGALLWTGTASAQTALANAAEPEAHTVEDIVVTASGFEQRVTQAPASITVVPREEIQEQRATSIAEILANVEGVDVGGGVGKTGGQTITSEAWARTTPSS